MTDFAIAKINSDNIGDTFCFCTTDKSANAI